MSVSSILSGPTQFPPGIPPDTVEEFPGNIGLESGPKVDDGEVKEIKEEEKSAKAFIKQGYIQAKAEWKAAISQFKEFYNQGKPLKAVARFLAKACAAAAYFSSFALPVIGVVATLTFNVPSLIAYQLGISNSIIAPGANVLGAVAGGLCAAIPVMIAHAMNATSDEAERFKWGEAQKITMGIITALIASSYRAISNVFS